MKTLTVIALAALGGIVACWTPLWARSVPSQSVDQELFRDASGDAMGRLDQRLHEELGNAAKPDEENPLAAVARQMHEVEERIAQRDSGTETQDQERRILAELDKLIEQAAKCCAGSKPPKPGQKPCKGQCSKSVKPGKKPSGKAGQGKAQPPDMAEIRQTLQKLWGELPSRQREQMLQSPVEEFLPKYQQMIEDYFKRLSEEKQAP